VADQSIEEQIAWFAWQATDVENVDMQPNTDYQRAMLSCAYAQANALTAIALILVRQDATLTTEYRNAQ
jgi:hypothetical protein